MRRFLVYVFLLLGTLPASTWAAQYQEITPVRKKSPSWTEVTITEVVTPPSVIEEKKLAIIPSTSAESSIDAPVFEPEKEVAAIAPTTHATLSIAPENISAPKIVIVPSTPITSDAYNPADDAFAKPDPGFIAPSTDQDDGVLQPQLVSGVTLPNRPLNMTPRAYAQSIPYRVGQLINAKITFYHAEPGRKNSAGFLPANGDVANNGLPLGTKVRLHGMPSSLMSSEMTVHDRMREDKPFYRFDIWLPSHVPIPDYGTANATVEILNLP